MEKNAEALDLTFESALARLTTIVETIERGEMPLEESLKLFEEGVQLSRTAHEKLHTAEKKIEELLSIDAQGKPKTAALG